MYSKKPNDNHIMPLFFNPFPHDIFFFPNLTFLKRVWGKKFLPQKFSQNYKFLLFNNNDLIKKRNQ